MNIELTTLDQNDPDHMGIMFKVRTHPQVARYLSQNPPNTFLDHLLYLNKAIESGKKQFFIIREKELMYGYCHITIHDESIELGWALHPNYWGRGIGKKSVASLIKYVSDSALDKEKKIILFVKKNNLRARNLYEKSGFIVIGEKENQDEYLMEFTKH